VAHAVAQTPGVSHAQVSHASLATWAPAGWRASQHVPQSSEVALAPHVPAAAASVAPASLEPVPLEPFPLLLLLLVAPLLLLLVAPPLLDELVFPDELPLDEPPLL
jgi:hypothetical protein